MNGRTQLSRINLFRYGIMALPLAFAGMPLYIHAPDFYATEFGVSLGVLGLVLLGTRVVDAVQDPLFGALSDRYAHKRSMIMLGGALMLGVGFAMLFHPPATYSIAWFALSMFLATSAFSLLGINLNAIGGLWSDDTHEKTRITTMREGIGLVGLLLAAVLPSILLNREPAATAFHYVSLIFIALLVVCSGIFLHWLISQRLNAGSGEARARTFSLSALFAMPKRLRIFYGVYGLSMLASSIPAVLVIFFIRDRLDAESYTGLFLALYFLSGAVGMPLWQWLSRITSKLFAWRVAMSIAIASFVWAFFLGQGDVVAYAIICVASGIALGAELALPPSILADALQDDDNRAEASRYFSLLTFLAKAGLALASGMVLPLIALAGYQPATNNSADSLWALSAAYALLPCLFKCAAIGLLYTLKDGALDHEEISDPLPDRSIADA